MKKILITFVAVLGLTGFVNAAPPVQDMGAVSTGTVFNISVGSNPTLATSTGTNVVNAGQTFTINRGTDTLPVAGDYLPGRVHLEFLNETGQDVYLGYDTNVSTVAGNRFRGRRIPHGGTWSTNTSIWHYYLRASTPTSQNFTVTQEK